LGGVRVVRELERLATERALPQIVVSDNEGFMRRHASPRHTFRAAGITIYLTNGGDLEKAQQMAAHESPRTTKLSAAGLTW
jgi:hypothetical protein